jgi:LmbE family N-acetylglucosaminyl deacetylase
MFRRAIRRLLASALFAALRVRAKSFAMLPPDSTLLVIAPHPDDEALGCGRLIAAQTDAGGVAHIAWLTDGEACRPATTSEKLACQRRAEGDAAASILGVPSSCCHRFGAPDGHLSSLGPIEREALVANLAALFGVLHPSEVLVTSSLDGSTEHEAAHALATAAIERLQPKPRLRTYLVWAHWNIRALLGVWRQCDAVFWRADPGRSARRAAAIGAHLSQTQPLPPATAPLLTPHFLACFPTNGEFYLDR